MSRKQSKADKFITFFDNDWKTCRSTVKHNFKGTTRNGSPLSSPIPRFQATGLPVQHGCPITLEGKVVIPLEQVDGYPILGSYKNDHCSHIPLTLEQEDLAMQSNIHGIIPMAETAHASGKVVCTDALPSFQNMDMRPPRFGEYERPSFMDEVGPQTDKKLMTPAQRRELLDFEVRKREADQYMRKAVSDRVRLKKQLCGAQYHRGVLMFDSTSNPESEIYGEKSKKLSEKTEKYDKFHSDRREYIDHVTGKSVAIVLNQTEESKGGKAFPVKHNKYYQSKGRVSEADRKASFDSTYDTLFGSSDIPHNVVRARQLRDQDLSGKCYDFIGHSLIETWPSDPGFTRQSNERKLHPSQITSHAYVFPVNNPNIRKDV